MTVGTSAEVISRTFLRGSYEYYFKFHGLCSDVKVNLLSPASEWFDLVKMQTVDTNENVKYYFAFVDFVNVTSLR